MKKGVSAQAKFMGCMLVILTAVIFSAVFSIVNLNQIRRSSADMMQNYMQVQRLYGMIEKKVETVQKYVNILVGSTDEDLQIAGDIYGLMDAEIVLIQEGLDALEETCQKTGREDLAGQFEMYKSGCLALLESMTVCADFREAGDLRSAKIYLGTDALTSILGQEQICLELENSVDTCLDNAQREVEKSIQSALTINQIISVVCTGCVIVTILLLQSCLLTPVKKMSERMLRMAGEIAKGQGNLTERIRIKHRDEIGRLQESINQLLEAFQEVTAQVKENAQHIENSANKTEIQVEASNDKIGSLSSVMEELSAASQEIAALTQQTNNEMREITDETKEIASEISHGTSFSDELKKRAGFIRQKTVESKEKAESIAGQIKQTMEKSIADSQNINQVSELTKAILEIAGKTNLLALNAAIEAARAGEAGKGFAVVAEEIRALADHSKKNASAIQELNNQVIEAVHALCKCGQDMVGFVDHEVMEDYKGFELMSSRYFEDADIVAELMENMHRSVEHMDGRISNISGNISGISGSIEESTAGIQNASGSVIEIVNITGDIYQEMCQSRQVSTELKRMSEGFIVE